VNWQIKTGERSVVGPGSAMDIVVGRLEYIVAQPRCNREKLMAEAIEYARLVRGWIREHEPKFERPVFDLHTKYIHARQGGKPGPMSDG
jgi:acyl CoA:acetate/3-ketoacid CoA transferase beta subunit